jgi:hypothetical protein
VALVPPKCQTSVPVKSGVVGQSVTGGLVHAACSHIPNVGLHSSVLPSTMPDTQSIMLLFVSNTESLSVLASVQQQLLLRP